MDRRTFVGSTLAAALLSSDAHAQPVPKAKMVRSNSAITSSRVAVSTEDRTINPDLERFMAKRMGAKTIEVKASHVSLISQPDAISNLILAAAGQA